MSDADAADPEPVAVEAGAAPTSAALALAAAGGAAVLAGTVTTTGLLAGLAGVGLLAVGLALGSAGAVTAGATGAFLGVLVAGVAGGGVLAVVGGTLCALLAGDLGEQALNVGEQVGRGPPTVRGELGHAAASAAVGLATAVGAVVVYRVATGGLAASSLLALSVAAVLLTAALRH